MRDEGKQLAADSEWEADLLKVVRGITKVGMHGTIKLISTKNLCPVRESSCTGRKLTVLQLLSQSC